MGKWTFEILLWGAGKSRLEKMEFLGGDKAAVEVMFITFFPTVLGKLSFQKWWLLVYQGCRFSPGG